MRFSPAFSTRAESHLYRSWGASIVGMTALPEAKLAREAEICYATLAFVTDFDCWHESAEPVSVEMVVVNLMQNAETAKNILKAAIAATTVKRRKLLKNFIKGKIHYRLESATGASLWRSWD